jgi:hypothetical protein
VVRVNRTRRPAPMMALQMAQTMCHLMVAVQFVICDFVVFALLTVGPQLTWLLR